jgi:Flp pilus assembly pilin Flp
LASALRSVLIAVVIVTAVALVGTDLTNLFINIAVAV